MSMQQLELHDEVFALREGECVNIHQWNHPDPNLVKGNWFVVRIQSFPGVDYFANGKIVETKQGELICSRWEPRRQAFRPCLLSAPTRQIMLAMLGQSPVDMWHIVIVQQTATPLAPQAVPGTVDQLMGGGIGAFQSPQTAPTAVMPGGNPNLPQDAILSIGPGGQLPPLPQLIPPTQLPPLPQLIPPTQGAIEAPKK